MKIYTIEKKLKNSTGTFDWFILRWVMRGNYSHGFDTVKYGYLPNKETAQEIKSKYAGSNSRIRVLEVPANEWLIVANLYAVMEGVK